MRKETEYFLMQEALIGAELSSNRFLIVRFLPNTGECRIVERLGRAEALRRYGRSFDFFQDGEKVFVQRQATDSGLHLIYCVADNPAARSAHALLDIAGKRSLLLVPASQNVTMGLDNVVFFSWSVYDKSNLQTDGSFTEKNGGSPLSDEGVATTGKSEVCAANSFRVLRFNAGSGETSQVIPRAKIPIFDGQANSLIVFRRSYGSEGGEDIVRVDLSGKVLRVFSHVDGMARWGGQLDKEWLWFTVTHDKALRYGYWAALKVRDGRIVRGKGMPAAKVVMRVTMRPLRPG